jgi:chemotaxis signal transduction protein
MSDQVDLILFELLGRQYGVALEQVQRIVNTSAEAGQLDVLAQKAGERSLLLRRLTGGTLMFNVDKVLGVKRVQATALRPMPKAVGAHPFFIGVLVENITLTLLIDADKIGDAASGWAQEGST